MTASGSNGDGELRPAYRTLAEPSQLLGLSIGGWATVITAAAMGYGWLHLSPLPWRANASLVVIGLGAPVALLLLREASAISPARLLVAALRWRGRPSHLSARRPPTDGAVRLTVPPAPPVRVEEADELPWIDAPHRYRASEPADPVSYRASDPADRPGDPARDRLGMPARPIVGPRYGASDQAEPGDGRAPESTVGEGSA